MTLPNQPLREAGKFRPRGGKEIRVCRHESCENTFEAYKSQNKRYCRPQCRYSSADMAGLLKRNLSGIHVLSDVDPINLTGKCAVCGPVQVRRRTDTRKHANRDSWRCRTAERARVWALAYGLSINNIDGILFAQEFKCAVCKTQLNNSFHVDHCHKSGQVRGLLCSNCNTGLGLFQDNPDLLTAAAAYLRIAVTEPKYPVAVTIFPTKFPPKRIRN